MLFSLPGLEKELSYKETHFLEGVQLVSVAEELVSPAFLSKSSPESPHELGFGVRPPLCVRRDPTCPREPQEPLEENGKATGYRKPPQMKIKTPSFLLDVHYWADPLLSDQ